MASKRKGKGKRNKPSGGTLSGMRSGMQRMAGSSPKRGKHKQETTFVQVFAWVLGVALLLVLVWGMTR